MRYAPLCALLRLAQSAVMREALCRAPRVLPYKHFRLSFSSSLAPDAPFFAIRPLLPPAMFAADMFC